MIDTYRGYWYRMSSLHPVTRSSNTIYALTSLPFRHGNQSTKQRDDQFRSITSNQLTVEAVFCSGQLQVSTTPIFYKLQDYELGKLVLSMLPHAPLITTIAHCLANAKD
jgi:hypothetical protein